MTQTPPSPRDRVQLRRSQTFSKRPETFDIEDGELAVNYNSGEPGLFVKDIDGLGNREIRKIGPVHFGPTPPNSGAAEIGSPTTLSNGETWIDTSLGASRWVLKVWSKSTGLWVEVSTNTFDGQSSSYYLSTSSTFQTKTGGLSIGGNVGIGIPLPTTKLDVDGSIKTSASVLVKDAQIDSRTTTRVNSTSQFVADYFPASTYRSTKYLVQVEETSTSNFHTCEVLIMHNGTEVYMTRYAVLETTISPVSSFDADIDNGNVRLLITPSVGNTITKVVRITVAK